MNVKRRLIRVLPDGAKRVLAVPYDYVQVQRADRKFKNKNLVDRTPAEEGPEHVVCVVVDALRGDVITEEDTPFMESLSGTTKAITPSGWTFPAVSSMLTGEYPHEHGAVRRHDEIVDGMDLPPRMPDQKETLTEVLAGAGYDTYGGFGHDTPFLALSGRFEHHSLHHKANSTAQTVFDDYLTWLGDHLEERTFAYLHLADPHVPVDPPEEYWGRYDVDRSIQGIRNWDYTDIVDCDQECERYRENRWRLYRAAVNYVDDALQEFRRDLEELGVDPLFMVTSDHGEMLWEHMELDVRNFEDGGAVDHGGTPYEQLTRVPLLTDDFGIDSSEVSLIDLAPTILSLTGLRDAMYTTGQSLVEPRDSDRIILVESALKGYERKAVYSDPYKLIVSKRDEVALGFRLPEEKSVEIPEDTREEMMAELPSWPENTVSEDGDDVHEVSGIVENRLENLGYK